MNGLELRGDIVVPGEAIGRNTRRGDFTYLEGSDVKAGVFGIKDERDSAVSVIPLAGKYMPKEGDMVVGVVSNVNRYGWTISINAPYDTYLNREKRRDDDEAFDLRRLYKEGDIVSVKIFTVDEVRNSYAEGPRKLVGGRIVILNAKKIPRVIGSKKSMLDLLRNKSGCRVVVGQNGIIWIDGPEKNMEAVVEAILKIEKESHTKGLTDRISEFMDERMKGLPVPKVFEEREHDGGERRERFDRGRGGDRRGRYNDRRGGRRFNDRPRDGDRPRDRDRPRDQTQQSGGQPAEGGQQIDLADVPDDGGVDEKFDNSRQNGGNCGQDGGSNV